MAKTASAPPERTIPTFLLYEDGGDAPEAVADFVHIETIRARAALHSWEIRPHRHAALHQFLLLLAGGGRVDGEGRVEAFGPATLVVTPAGMVHGYSFTPNAEGFVLTVADRFLEQCLDRGPEPLAYPDRVLLAGLEDEAELSLLTSAFQFLDAELAWRRQGLGRATAACLELILVAAARRLASPSAAGGSVQARQLVGRFKALVRAHAAEGWPVERYARDLGVSVEQLNRSCRAAASRSPMRIVHDRLISEARRSLIYTCMTVQEIGLSLGFTDPAYFTRFFTQREGCSPSHFRRRALV